MMSVEMMTTTVGTPGVGKLSVTNQIGYNKIKLANAVTPQIYLATSLPASPTE